MGGDTNVIGKGMKNVDEVFQGLRCSGEVMVFMHNGVRHEIPVASKEYTAYIEQQLMASCMPQESRIPVMDIAELEDFLYIRAMSYDVERGLGLGQIPHIHFEHSIPFLLWERRLHRRMEERMTMIDGHMKEQEQVNILPFDRSYWVIPGRFLAGEIPSSAEPAKRLDKAKSLVRAGVDTVINLMEPGEKTFQGDVLADYQDELARIAKRYGREVEVIRFPVRDLSVPDVSLMRDVLRTIDQRLGQGLTVYVHCWGGVGRTGTVVGCYLLENRMATTDTVMETIRYLKRTTPIKDRQSPETQEQVDFILDWPVARTDV
jgi:hypothetical protein